MVTIHNVVLGAVVGVLTLIEYVYSQWIAHDKYYEWPEALINLFMFIIYTVIMVAAVTLIAAPIYDRLFLYSPWKFSVDSWWSWPMIVLLTDLVAYWGHRLAHRNRFLWALHFSHHSAERFNLTIGFRLSWLHGLVNIAYSLPFALLGIPLQLVFFGVAVVSGYSFFVHTPYVRKLPDILEALFHCPTHHRVHHGRNDLYIDKNFSVMFIFWDRFFGTFQKEVEEPIYGADYRILTNNPLLIQFTGIYRFVKSRLVAPQIAK